MHLRCIFYTGACSAEDCRANLSEDETPAWLYGCGRHHSSRRQLGRMTAWLQNVALLQKAAWLQGCGCRGLRCCTRLYGRMSAGGPHGGMIADGSMAAWWRCSTSADSSKADDCSRQHGFTRQHGGRAVDSSMAAWRRDSMNADSSVAAWLHTSARLQTSACLHSWRRQYGCMVADGSMAPRSSMAA